VANYLRVEAESTYRQCVLRVIGELDLITAAEFAHRADAAVKATTGPVVVDLSSLTFIDARGARALAAVIRTVPAARRPVIRSCPPHVRLVLDMLNLPLCYLLADPLIRTPGPSVTLDLVDRVRHARLDAGKTKLAATWAMARLTDSGIRLASTVERTGLIREQGQQTLARTRSARERA
jgi:anti-sigma B factor antagonist